MLARRSLLRSPLALGAAALVVAAAAPAVARAQGVEVTPYFASYYPLANIGRSDEFEEKQTSAAGLGARVTVPVAGAVTAEGSVSYVWSGTTITSKDGSGGSPGLLKGNIIYANGRVRFTPRRSNLYFLGGAGIVKRGGPTWSGGNKTLTSAAGVIGAGVRAHVTPAFALDVGAEVNLYNANMDKGGTTSYTNKFQQDVLITIGVPIRLGVR